MQKAQGLRGITAQGTLDRPTRAPGAGRHRVRHTQPGCPEPADTWRDSVGSQGPPGCKARYPQSETRGHGKRALSPLSPGALGCKHVLLRATRAGSVPPCSSAGTGAVPGSAAGAGGEELGAHRREGQLDGGPRSTTASPSAQHRAWRTAGAWNTGVNE